GIRDKLVTGVQTCALPISGRRGAGCRRLTRDRGRLLRVLLAHLAGQRLDLALEGLDLAAHRVELAFLAIARRRRRRLVLRLEGRSEERRVGKECGSGGSRE